jgi:poly(3-hydroxybutyrate) depolymerase
MTELPHRRGRSLRRATGVLLAAALAITGLTGTAGGAEVPSGTTTVTLTHAGQERRALVHVPAGYDGNTPLPTLLHFPGLLETPEFAELFDHHFEHADANGYLMVIPEHYGAGWQGVPGGPESPDVDDPGFIRALLDVLHQRYNADPARTYASGMSNGGFFTHLTACRLNDRFAAFAAVAGQMAPDLVASCSPGRALPMLMLHGDGDPVVTWDGEPTPVPPTTEFWSGNNGCLPTPTSTDLPNTDPLDNTTVTRHDWTGCAAPVTLYQIRNGGHTWPGGTPFLPPPLLGWHTYDISANDIIWEFVRGTRLN